MSFLRAITSGLHILLRAGIISSASAVSARAQNSAVKAPKACRTPIVLVVHAIFFRPPFYPNDCVTVREGSSIAFLQIANLFP